MSPHPATDFCSSRRSSCVPNSNCARPFAVPWLCHWTQSFFNVMCACNEQSHIRCNYLSADICILVVYSYIPHLNLYPVITYNFMRSHCCSTSSTCSRCPLEFYFTMNNQKQHLDKQFVQCTCIAWIYHHCMNHHETLFSWVWMAFYLDGTQLLTDDNDTVVGSHKIMIQKTWYTHTATNLLVPTL